MNSQMIKCDTLVSKVHYFYDLERICNVLSIHGIKRACVCHDLELKCI